MSTDDPNEKPTRAEEQDRNAEEIESAEQIDGAADTGPGTTPEGATPKVPRTTGDPLADANSR